MASAYVYILSSRMHGTLYVGVTTQVAQRIWQHRNGVTAGFALRHNIRRLVHVEPFEDIVTAREREKTLKNWRRSWKIALIEETNPTWRDLYDDILN